MSERAAKYSTAPPARIANYRSTTFVGKNLKVRINECSNVPY